MSSYPPPTINTVFNVADYPDAENGNISLVPPYVDNGVAVYKSDGSLHTSTNLVIDNSNNLKVGGTELVLNNNNGYDSCKLAVKRGVTGNAQRATIKWDDYNSMWACGMEGSELPIMPFSTFEPQVDSLMFLKSDGLVHTDADLTYNSTTKRIGLGVSTPTAKLHVTNTTTSASFIVEDSTNPDNDPFVIDNNGNVGIGLLTPASDTKLHIRGTTNLNPTIEGFSVTPKWSFYRAQGTSQIPTTVTNTTPLMSLDAYGYNGTASSYVQGASISAICDAMLNTSDMPSRLSFSTCPQAGTNIERMRITSLGHVVIGSTAYTDSRLSIAGATLDLSMTDNSGHNLTGLYKSLLFRNNTRNYYIGEGYRAGLTQDFSLLSSEMSPSGTTPINHLSFDTIANVLYVSGDVKCTGSMSSNSQYMTRLVRGVSYTILSTDPTYITPGEILLPSQIIYTLPACSSVIGKKIIIKCEGAVNGSGNTVLINRAGSDFINGTMTNVVIASKYGVYELYATFNGWMILNSI